MKPISIKWNTRFLHIESKPVEGKPEEKDRWMWHTGWTISLRKTNTRIGTIEMVEGRVEEVGTIIIHIDEEYRKKGYAKEALGDFIPWLFSQDAKLKLLTFTVEEEDEAAIRLCHRMGYRQVAEHVFECVRPDPSYGVLLMLVGMCMGLCCGQLFNTMGITLGIGALFGLSIGLGLEGLEKKKVKTFLREYHKSRPSLDYESVEKDEE